MSLSRRLIFHVLLALMLVVGVSPAAAAPAADHSVDTSFVTFSIAPDRCHLLPAGVGVDGSGESLTITNTRTLSDGSMEVRITNVIKGVATDTDGGVHRFVYQNSSTQTIQPSGFTTISMTDVFALSGPGPHYSVGFNWSWTFTQPAEENLWPPSGPDWVQHSGDPDDVLVCDPL
jgi:hypothetical protein